MLPPTLNCAALSCILKASCMYQRARGRVRWAASSATSTSCSRDEISSRSSPSYCTSGADVAWGGEGNGLVMWNQIIAVRPAN